MRTNLISMKAILFAASTLFIFSQCTEEEIAPSQPIAAVAETPALAVEPTGSMTISGIYATYEAIEDCSTCTFVVPADVTVVDGKEFDLKPGSVICLDKSIKYGDVDFVNLEGTEANPIKIGLAEIVRK